MKRSTPLRRRQIHLDFHNSEHIPDVGGQFDPDEFVTALESAEVDSVTIFAKCHHGWSYYPTKVGAQHPNLARPDLLGDMVRPLKAAGIECPVYISAMWDERNARIHPEWRVRSATKNSFDVGQLAAGWHTLCLNYKAYRDELLDQAREVVRDYEPPGLFFDIVLTADCVCAECLATMDDQGLDPEVAADRLQKDEWVNERFRSEMTAALHRDVPELRIFYNCGHIHKQGAQRFASYTHLEIESLPTGGWGYDHFPTGARYAAFLGFDAVGHTGKFHTSWGEFGGFKHPDALEYEAARTAALGVKCLVGDQLHPNGAINPDTYASIAPAYRRIAKLEPYLDGARQIAEVAIVSSEYFHPGGARNSVSDDGAAQMLLELKHGFDVIDPSADFADYRLVILPDDIPVDAEVGARLTDYAASGGAILLTGRSGIDDEDRVAVPAGIAVAGPPVGFNPSYMRAGMALDAQLPSSPFVMYGVAQSVAATDAAVLAEVAPSYFNRSYRHFCSHQHAPDDPRAEPLGAGVTIRGSVAYVAYPIFEMYQAIGQPLYKYVVRGLLNRLLPKPVLTTDLPSAGGAWLACQAEQHRHILHLLYGPPQVRGKRVPDADGSVRVMEMIEDLPALGPVRAEIRLPNEPSRVYDAISGEEIAWSSAADGVVAVSVPRLHIHTAVVFEGTVS